MSSTSFITLSLLIKLWMLGVIFYLIRTTSSEFDITLRNEILCYAATSLAVLGSKSVLGYSIGGGDATEMTRQESDLVKDYLKNRTKGETLGEYLIRIEAEEEHQQQLEFRYRGGRHRRSKKPGPKSQIGRL